MEWLLLARLHRPGLRRRAAAVDPQRRLLAAEDCRQPERDARKAAALEAAGWTVLSFWGHEDPAVAAAVAAGAVAARRAS